MAELCRRFHLVDSRIFHAATWLILLVTLTLPYCDGQAGRPQPPWGSQFDNSVVVRTFYGDVRGFTVPMLTSDLNDYERTDGPPLWFARRVNCFLGIPYALPPIGDLRFKLPKRPRWGGTWEANYFRPACPQELDNIREDIPDYPSRNVSEDCLYMNIYAPNITWYEPGTLYPVMVWIHGGDFLYGSAQQQPGQVMATREVIIVSFNFRLGALGFLTTEDEYGPGNWGLHDQQLALEFVKQNIRQFQGDPDQITIFGDGTGAASVGLHMLSPKSRGKGFYHQAILMSGVDTSPFAYIDPYWRPREYAFEFGRLMGCPSTDSYLMLECLRNNDSKSWQAMLEVQKQIKPKAGGMGIVWGPVQDGGYHRVWPFLPETPVDMRDQRRFDNVPTIIGINTNDGCKIANATVRGLAQGLEKKTFKDKIDEFLTDFRVLSHYKPRVRDAIEFQYTWWPDPENASARTQEYINMMTDMQYGAWVDRTVKQTCDTEPTYMYVFNYRSWEDWRKRWMGISYSAAVPYVFGFPFFNETVLNETEVVPRQWYDYMDRNISDFMLTMWTNFAKYGNPTPNITRNVTWQPFNNWNLSFLIVEEYSYQSWRYRQPKYGFWRGYFPYIAKRDYLYPTATPTPAGYQYVIGTGSMSAVLFLLLVVLGACMFLLYWQRQQEDKEDAYRTMPLGFMNTQMTASTTSTAKTPLSIMYPDDTLATSAGKSVYDDIPESPSGLQGAGALGLGEAPPRVPYTYKHGRPDFQSMSGYDTASTGTGLTQRAPYSNRGGRPDYSAGFETASSTMGTDLGSRSTYSYKHGRPGTSDVDSASIIAPEPARRAPYTYRHGRPSHINLPVRQQLYEEDNDPYQQRGPSQSEV